jgi:hypothetical protein
MRITKSWALRALAVASCAPACTNQDIIRVQAPAEVKVEGTTQALAGREGKLEFAIDAPWRLEPVGFPGNWDHGAIPITISVHDANMMNADGDYSSIGDFLSLEIEESSPHGTATRSVAFEELREVEAVWGAWQYNTSTRPPNAVCEPASGDDCSNLESLANTSAWHATYWYVPQTRPVAGDNVELGVELRVRAGLHVQVQGPNGADLESGPGTLRLKEHLKVHYAEAPLPRFGDGWLYGDLHYHSENTDNEGEAGYGYRSTLRAMGSLGMDFAFATEHASNSRQVTDIDIDTSPKEYGALRDMSPERFRYGLDKLHGTSGANTSVLTNPGGRLAQNIRGRAVAPQIYLGGEVDAIPEVVSNDIGVVTYGNGKQFDLNDLVFAAGSPVDIDPTEVLVRGPSGGYGVRSWAGGTREFTRQHLVYMPYSATDRDGFVGSNTTDAGGASRWFGDIASSISQHGSAFLAHPMNAVGEDSRGITDFGPDMFPYTDWQLSQAFASPGILGLQLWNENVRLRTDIGEGDSFNTASFDRSLSSGGTETGRSEGICTKSPSGALECLVEIQPAHDTQGFQWQYSGTPTYNTSGDSFTTEKSKGGLYSDLHHGTFVLDRMLRDGLNPAKTAGLAWLPQGEPRRVFLAGGSDAHGDLNFRREGYFFGTNEVSSTAMGTPRNLVFAGAPRAEPPPRQTQPGNDTIGPASSSTTLGTGATLGTSATLSRSASLSTSLSSSASVAPALSFSATAKGGAGVPTDPQPGNGELAPPDSTRPTVRYGQSQVVDALRSGNFAVTDGPALRIVIDRNTNGIIDDQDVPMGGIANLYTEQNLPLLVEWKSTAEFGPVASIDLYVGSVAGSQGRTYAPVNHGVRASVDPNGNSRQVYPHWDGQIHTEMNDHYFADTTGMLRIQLPVRDGGVRSYEGVRAISLPLRRFPASNALEGEGTSFYVRAFAKTEPENWQGCTGQYRNYYHRSGQCLERLAYTNPVWALRKAKPAGCPADPRALDHDQDGEPNHCDACAGVAGPNCIAPTPVTTQDKAFRFGGSLIDEATAVATDDKGNFFAAGTFQGSFNHGTQSFVSQGANDGFVAKYGADGSLKWIKAIGGTGDMRIQGIAMTAYGDPIVTGYFNGEIVADADNRTTASSNDPFIIQLYGRHFTDAPVVRRARFLGGTGHTEARAVHVNDRGNVFVGGSYSGYVATGAGGLPNSDAGSDCYVLEFDGNNNHLSSLGVRGSGDCEVTGISSDGEDLIVSGRYTGTVDFAPGTASARFTSASGYNGFVVRYRGSRFYSWSASLGDNAAGCAASSAEATAVDVDDSGNIYVAGHTSACLGVTGASQGLLASGLTYVQPYVAVFTPQGAVYTGAGLGLGTTVQQNRYANGFRIVPGGGFVVVGNSVTITIVNRRVVRNSDVWVGRYVAVGMPIWSETYGSTGQESALACDADANGFVAVAGRFSSSLAIGDASQLLDAGNGDAFVARLAP